MSAADNTILGLQLPTDPRWVNLAEFSLEEVLTDHAFCEQKAATQCISLIQLYPDKENLVNALAPIVTEEWGHFRIVLAELSKRGYTLGKQRKDDYVNGLLQTMPKAIPAEERMLHKLLFCALIEARSCERFRLLSEQLTEEAMRKFYHRFMVSEAGHYRLFIDLAKAYYPPEKVKTAWQFWLNAEKNLLQTLTPAGNRMH